MNKGLIVTDAVYHGNGTLNTFCIMWAMFTVKSLVELVRRSSEPDTDVFLATVYGLDSKVDYRALMTRKDGLWRIEFYVGVAAV